MTPPEQRPRVEILYVANARIPSVRAHSIQIIRTCAALTRAGAEIEVWMPRRSGVEYEPPTSDEILRYYAVPAPYPMHRLPCIDVIDRLAPARQRPAFLMQTATFVASVRRRLRRCSGRYSHRCSDFDDCWIYVRDPHTLAFLGWRQPDLRSRIAFEAHALPRTAPARRRLARALRGVAKVIALNAELASGYEALGVDSSSLAIIAADAPSSAPLPDRDLARQRLGFDPEQRVVLYAGSFGPTKDVEVQIAAARGLRAPWRWVLVGGDDASCQRLRSLAEGLSHVDIRGPVRPAMVDDYLAAADVLVATGSADDPASASWTSPMKLFEYDRARRPVVVSDLPAMRAAAEQLTSDGYLFWCRPGDPEDLARTVQQAWLRRADLADRQPLSDRQLVRAKSILEHLRS